MKHMGWVALTVILFSTVAYAQDTTDTSNRADTTETVADTAYQVEDGKLFFVTGESKKKIPLNQTVLSIHKYQDELYIALGKDGVAVMPLLGSNAGTIKKIIPVSHGKVTELVEMDDTLWMKVDSTTAVQLHRSDNDVAGSQTIVVTDTPLPQQSQDKQAVPAPVVAPPTSNQTSTLPSTLRILKIHPGMVTLDKGAQNGIKAGDRFKVYRMGGIFNSSIEEFNGEQVVAVLVVEAVNENNSLAKIWRGDRIRQSDTVRPDPDKKDASLVYPRAFRGIGEVQSTIRPIINIGARGFGALSDLMIAYYFPHVFVDFRIQPLGFGWTEGKKVITNSMVLSGGYNARAFAVGIGVGITSVNGNLTDMMNSYGVNGISDASYSDNSEPSWEQRTKHAFSLAQRVRLGSKEGLRITIDNTLLYYKKVSGDDTPSGFIYAGTAGRITWPLSLRTDMFVEGGGGVMGFGFGALGVFTWLRGNGDAGSIGLSISAGGAGIWSEKQRETNGYTEIESVTISGPMFSVGMTYRFGAMK